MTVLSLNGKPAHTIDDSNWRDVVPDSDFRLKDNRGNEFYTGCLPLEEWDISRMATVPFEASGIILWDEKELKERIEDMWAAQASLMHLNYKRDSLYQNRGTCWIHGTCTAAAQLIEASGLPYRVPSPMSVAYHCYSNYGVNGGYPSLGVEKFQEYGAVRTEMWGENERRDSLNGTTMEDRKHHTLPEIVEAGGGEEGFHKTMCGIAQGHPAGWSFRWWSHYVCGCWGRVDNGELCGGLRNTWSNSGYGDKGFGLLKGSRKYPSWSCIFLRVGQSPG